MRPADAPFRHSLRVYWEDTDAAGIVFYANYLKFFERARSEWLRARGVEQERLRAEARIGFVVTDTSLRYHAPARLDDLIDVTVEPQRLGAASMALAQQAWRADRLLVSATLRCGCVDLGTYRPTRIPNDLLDRLR